MIDSQDDVFDFCTGIKFGSDICFFGFYDGNLPLTESGDLFDKYRKVAQLFLNQPFHFGWVDGTCHQDLRAYFEMGEGTLQLAAYYPVRKRFVGMEPKKKLRVKDFEKFVGSLKSYSEEATTARKQHPFMREKKCVEFYEQFGKNKKSDL